MWNKEMVVYAGFTIYMWSQANHVSWSNGQIILCIDIMQNIVCLAVNHWGTKSDTELFYAMQQNSSREIELDIWFIFA